MHKPHERRRLWRVLRLAGLLCFAFAVYGCEILKPPDAGGGTEDQPPPPPVCASYDTIRVDAQFLITPTQRRLNPYGSNKGYIKDRYAEGMLKDIFDDACVRILLADPRGWESDIDTVNTTDWARIWMDAHWTGNLFRPDSFPHFLISMALHDSVDEDGYNMTGVFANPQPCSCGTARYFGAWGDYAYAMIFYDKLENQEYQISRMWLTNPRYEPLFTYSRRVWGYTMAHELGHLYACLRDYDRADSSWYHTTEENSWYADSWPCVMRFLDQVNKPDLVLDLLSETADHYYGSGFCPRCTTYIRMVGQ